MSLQVQAAPVAAMSAKWRPDSPAHMLELADVIKELLENHPGDCMELSPSDLEVTVLALRVAAVALERARRDEAPCPTLA